MDFSLTPEQEAFAAEVRSFLDAHLPANDPVAWNRALREKRWVGFTWPREYGGGGGDVMREAILKREMAQRGAPPLGLCYMGLAWVGPALLQYGTEAQKRRFLPDILDGHYQWCTGYSEPQAGSDLASLRCRAMRQGEGADAHYVVSGQKIWTSLAPVAEWMILLVRTGTPGEGRKHEGITCLLVEMGSPGVEVRPIENMVGGTEFAEVFLKDVRVPADQRLGEEGQGWAVTLSALAHERSSIAEVQALRDRLERLWETSRACEREGRAVLSDAELRRRLARIETRIEGMRLNGLRLLTRQLRGEPLGAQTSINKLQRAELEVEMGDLGLELWGLASALLGDAAPEGGHWQTEALSWPATVIGGGTPNIQKNIIAERILRLARD